MLNFRLFATASRSKVFFDLLPPLVTRDAIYERPLSAVELYVRNPRDVVSLPEFYEKNREEVLGVLASE